MDTMVDVNDEFMHEPGPHPDWQESFFFSWFDAESDAVGLARIGYRPSNHTADAILYTMRNGRVEGGYARLHVRYTGTPQPDHLKVGALEFQMVEPMSKWRLLLRGRHEVDLTWTALHAPFDYHAEAPPGAYLPSGIADTHMEQSGWVTGRVRINGSTYPIDGLGQRDKSWGVRLWSSIERWDWNTVLLSPDFTMNCTHLFDGDLAYPTGYIFHDGACHAVAQLTVDHEWSGHQVPCASRMVVTDVSGLQLEIRGRVIAQSCLWKRGLVIQESATRFETVVDGRPFTGLGLTEHAWHAGLVGSLRVLPRMGPAAKMVMP
jgi:hypothetical protein